MGELLGQLGTQQPAAPAQDSSEFEGIDDDEVFVMAILGTTETLWTDVFAASGETYVPARVVLFSNATESACGGANSATGPHYCPLDETVCIDLTFYDELQRRFGADGGDFAADANEYSVRLELQADCLAGVWANSIFQRDNVLEDGDIREGLSAAESVGDDRI